MFVESNVMVIRAITPVHAGNGRALGLIDMPIQKEKHTGIPKIEGSSLKGSLREAFNANKDINKNENSFNDDTIFGPADNGNESAGLVGFTDAKLLFYPIISINTLFTYVTCPYLLNRFIEDNNLSYSNEVKKSNNELAKKIEIVPPISDGKCVLLQEYKALSKEDRENGECSRKSVILAEYEFEYEKCSGYDVLINQIIKDGNLKLKKDKDVVVISDTDFIEMINLTRDIITRNKIDHETGTVAESGPFTEEYLPAESILYFLALKNGISTENEEAYEKYLNTFASIVQIGGNATIGKGITEISQFRMKAGEDK